MHTVGLTGGIGSGKSTVGRILQVLGIPVFDADKAGRELYVTDDALCIAVIERFGDAVHTNGRIDRKALAAVVFNDAEALSDLNALVHPAVRAAYVAWVAEQQAPYTVMESALLFETGRHTAFDRVITVEAPLELRIRRVMIRDGVEEGSVRARARAQASEVDRRSIAHHVILNDDSTLVIPQVTILHRALITFAP